MAVDEYTNRAIQITRDILTNMVNNPWALAVLISNGVTPEDAEDTITDILKYMAKTKPEELTEAKNHPFSLTKPQLKHELERICDCGWITNEQVVKALMALGYTKKEAKG